MFQSRIFTTWFVLALAAWAGLFVATGTYSVIGETWIYPAIMVLGAFVAGLTPEGGGAVAFPVLSVFFEIDRPLARDFSLMIQSIGMTSASIFILSHPSTDRAAFRPLLWFLPICFAGFAAGMLTLQAIPVYIIQALFLALIATFSAAYVFNTHRGDRPRLRLAQALDRPLIAAILFIGGMCASLFGTGADIILYTLMVSRFRLEEKTATQMSIVLMASTSVFGFAWRAFIDGDLAASQFQAWLSAWPVVLFMAPFGVYVLKQINVEWMLRFIVLLNIAQLVYFNVNNPSAEKLVASGLFSILLFAVFWAALSAMARRRAVSGDVAQETGPAG